MSLRPQGMAAAVVMLAAVFSNCSRPAPQAQVSNHYVNPAECAGCHADIAKTYRHTGMARAFSRPSNASFPQTKPYFHRASATWFQVVERQNSFYQRTWQAGWKGGEESVGELKIDYVMGSGNHVRTFLHRTARGTLTELPLAWYAEKGGYWALNPGFDTSRPPAARKIGYDCMFCHNAYPSIPAGHNSAGSEPVFKVALPEGIDCQRCHGPGENHVQSARTRNVNLKGAIVNPSHLSKERAMEVCLQCHLETTSFPLPNAIRRFDRGPFSYQPGEPLSAFILFFDHAPGSGRENKFEIVSSAYRLRKSQCFLQSKGALTCTTCHNPHDIPHGPDAAEHYNGVCRQCHAATLASLITTKRHPDAGSCIDCHMPKRRTEDVIHAAVTDHLIQRGPAAGGLLAELAERHGEAAEYRGDVVPYGDADGLYTAVAQVSARSNLEKGLPLLEAAIATNKPSRAEFYLVLGDAWRDTKQFAKALAAYRQALEKTPGSVLILRRIADVYKANGRPREALAASAQATQSEPENAEAWYDLGLLQSELDTRLEAIKSLERALKLDPEFAEAQNSLGAVLAETGRAYLAEAAFRDALRMNPTLSATHANLANLLAGRNDLAQAVWHYERAGGNALDQFNFAVTLVRMNRFREAETHLQAALKEDPNLAEAHDVLGGILETNGRPDEALNQYREAVRSRSNFGKAHLDLGTLLALRHDLAGAAEEFRKAAADPNPEMREQAARALQSLPNGQAHGGN